MEIKLYHGDCLEIMQSIPAGSIDMVLCDPPYGITKNDWDKRLPLDELWRQYDRITKPNSCIAIFADGLFMADLMASNRKNWHYNLIWQKTMPVGFLNANRMPLKATEEICIFYRKQPVYNPQKTTGHKPVHSYTKHSSDGSNYGKTKPGMSGGGSTERYPTNLLTFPLDKQRNALHPTQKPVALLEWLIKTYTNPGGVVLDNCMGSGSTGVAALNTGRDFVGIELDENYYYIAERRILSEES